MYVFPFWLSPVDHPALSHANEKEPKPKPRCFLGLTFFLFVGGTFPCQEMPCPFVFVISEGSSLKSTLFMLQLENENRWNHFFRIGRVRYHLLPRTCSLKKEGETAIIADPTCRPLPPLFCPSAGLASKWKVGQARKLQANAQRLSRVAPLLVPLATSENREKMG